MRKILKKIVDPNVQIGISVVLIFGSFIGWPITALTIARHEPPLILGLSWLALAFAGYAGLVGALGNKAADEK